MVLASMPRKISGWPGITREPPMISSVAAEAR